MAVAVPVAAAVAKIKVNMMRVFSNFEMFALHVQYLYSFVYVCVSECKCI